MTLRRGPRGLRGVQIGCAPLLKNTVSVKKIMISPFRGQSFIFRADGPPKVPSKLSGKVENMWRQCIPGPNRVAFLGILLRRAMAVFL